MTEPAPDVPGPGVARQMAAMVRMELLALRRNPTAAALVAAGPLVLGFLRISGHDTASVGDTAAVARMAGTLGIIMVIFVHHHLVTVYAARRQELVLKRLRAGLPSDWTILAGAASGTTVIFFGQALLLATYGVLVLGLPLPANLLTVLLATLLVAALMAAVSAAVSAMTRSSEAAMLTTLPTMALFLLIPGILIPLGELSPGIENAAWFLPMGPFPEVVRDGWLGHDANGNEISFLEGVIDAMPALAVLSGWLVLTLLAVRYFFRWEPRRG
jgi:ABC-2 type transport system permease protein